VATEEQGKARPRRLQGKDNLSHPKTAAKRRGRDPQGDLRQRRKRSVISPPPKFKLSPLLGGLGDSWVLRAPPAPEQPPAPALPAQRAQTQLPAAGFLISGKPTQGPHRLRRRPEKLLRLPGTRLPLKTEYFPREFNIF